MTVPVDRAEEPSHAPRDERATTVLPVPATFSIVRDGRAIGGLDWGGQGTDVLFLHANGFCAGVF